MSVWTEDHDQMLRDLRDAGHTFKYIAGVLGKTRNACIGRARRIEVAGARPAAKRWELTEVEDLQAALKSGLDLRTIAVVLERPVEGIRHKIEALGLDRPARSFARPATSRTAQNEGVRRLKPQIAGRVGAAKAAAISGDLGKFVTRPAGPPRPQHRVQPVVDGSIPFIERTSQQCAFILGDHRQLPAMCCGKSVQWGKDGTPTSWCSSHHALVYRPSEAVSSPEKVAA